MSVDGAAELYIKIKHGMLRTMYFGDLNNFITDNNRNSRIWGERETKVKGQSPTKVSNMNMGCCSSWSSS